MPVQCKAQFPTTRVIIDASVIAIQKPATSETKVLHTQLTSKHEAEEDVQEAHEHIEQKVDALAAGVEKTVVVSDSVKEIVSGTLEEDRAEEEEIQKRKTSIRVHGLLEPQSSTATERKQDTIEHLMHSLRKKCYTSRKKAGIIGC